MSERVQRDFRRQASKVAAQTVAALAPGVEAAMQNEQLTRQRVDALEGGLKDLTSHADEAYTSAAVSKRILDRPFLGRLAWLFTGK